MSVLKIILYGFISLNVLTLILYVYFGYISEYKLARQIILYLKEKEIEATDAREFDFRERVKYPSTRNKVLTALFFGIFYFAFYRLGEYYYRVIDIEKKGEKKTIYAEIFVRLRKIEEFEIIDYKEED